MDNSDQQQNVPRQAPDDDRDHESIKTQRQQSRSVEEDKQKNESSPSWLDGFDTEHYDPKKEAEESRHGDPSSQLPPLPDHMMQNPLLQVPCAIQAEYTSSVKWMIHPVATFVDTGAQVSILSRRAAQRARVLHLIDRRYAGHAIGVGQRRVLGRIPAGKLRLHLHGQSCIPAPAITILEDDEDVDDVSYDDNQNDNQGVDGKHNDERELSAKSNAVELLLGLDFLRDYQAILNLRENEMRLLVKDQQEMVIPFIVPRAPAQEGSQYPFTPILQQCKSYVVPLGNNGGEDDLERPGGRSNSEPIDMSGV